MLRLASTSLWVLQFALGQRLSPSPGITAGPVVALLCLSSFASSAMGGKTENVILITMDGLRWQEVFTGADPRLMTKEAGDVEQPDVLRARYYRDDVRERRELLMPFLWSEVASHGQVIGDPRQGSSVTVTNGQLFSYPGYNELLCGFGDPSITSNAKQYNKNVTVLEWLNRKPSFAGRVAAFTSWDVFPFIINTQRSGIYVNAGWQPLEHLSHENMKLATNSLVEQLPHYWAGVRYDAITNRGAVEYLKLKQPRVLYVALGETDDWAHAGRYDLYLDAARQNDRCLRELWQTIQSMEHYRDKTSLVITTDHGRGDGREGWKNHSATISGSDRMWLAVVGPDTPAKGIRKNTKITQSQVASTVASLLEEDFQRHDSRIVEPVEGIVAPKVRLIAHRGGVVDERRIENSLPAIEEAVRRGYYMLEVDIRESKDGHLVVHHDPDFRRFYGDDRKVADLTWGEIKEIRSHIGKVRPLEFAEFAAACEGKIELMLDTKEPDHSIAFFEEMERILRKHGLLKNALVIGTEQSRDFLHGKAKVSVDKQQLLTAIDGGEDVSRLYFLFEHGDMDRVAVGQANKYGVTIVPSVNVFHYPPNEHLSRAAADIERLRHWGVSYFQIDSVYEEFCRDGGEEKSSAANSRAGHFPAPEAVQAVAVDAHHFYAIANSQIGKYDKQTGQLVKRWGASTDVPLEHLNSGVVIDGKLYCAHSNYPRRPETSSIEIWDTATMQHVASRSFGIYEGSLTWIDWHKGSWWAVFAHYSRKGHQKDNRWTSLVQFDSGWRRIGAWAFPKEILRRFHPHSCSGGCWGPDELLYCTGHDRGEVYRLRLPKSGSTLSHVDTMKLPITGQGIAWDRDSDDLYGINRPYRQVIKYSLTKDAAADRQGHGDQ